MLRTTPLLGALALVGCLASSPVALPPPGLASSHTSSVLAASVNGFTMTVATELGDKTFMIAAIMAMKYNRLIIFTGAAGALLVMTVLSVGIGVALPTLLPKQYTHYAAAALFAYFGLKLLHEAQGMPAESNGENSELAEAEEELAAKLGTGSAELASGRAGAEGEGGAVAVHVEDGEGSSSSSSGSSSGGHRSNGSGAVGGSGGSGGSGSSTPALGASSPALGASSEDEFDPSAKSGVTKRAAALAMGGSSVDAASNFWASLKLDWPILTQAFMITFLAEWGDRSQIATIAMAAAQHPVGVALGAFVGHAGCTALAVIGGRLLASRISERLVALSGGVLFLLFALHSILVGPDVDE